MTYYFIWDTKEKCYSEYFNRTKKESSRDIGNLNRYFKCRGRFKVVGIEMPNGE